MGNLRARRNTGKTITIIKDIIILNIGYSDNIIEVTDKKYF